MTSEDWLWYHYMACPDLARIERLAELLRCRDDEVEDIVRRLAGYRPIWRPSRLRRWWYRMDKP